jgi:hypothetical protein
LNRRPADGSSDGNKLKYLDNDDKWAPLDSELYYHLQTTLQSDKSRSVFSIEYSNLLNNTAYFSDIVPRDSDERNNWFYKLIDKASEADIVFFDPDIGMEVPSAPYGTKKSPMYLYWREVQEIWKKGKSLIIYQHFRGEERNSFKKRILSELNEHINNSFIDAITSSNVIFLLALQPHHKIIYKDFTKDLDMHWGEQLSPVNPKAFKIKAVKGHCPNCNSTDIGKVVYGMPSYEFAMSDDVQSGKIVLGGCCIEVGAPTYKCNICDAYIFKGWKKYEFRDD